MPIGVVFVGLPRYSGCFYYDSIFESRQLCFKFRQVEPCDCIIVHDFEPKNVRSLERETIINMLQFDTIFTHHYSKHIGGFLIVIVLRYEVVYQCHFFFRHLPNNSRSLLLNVYYKFNLLIVYCNV